MMVIGTSVRRLLTIYMLHVYYERPLRRSLLLFSTLLLLPAGSTIMMSQYLMHRDPRYYNEPGRFDLERWSSEAKSSVPRFSYFPFGGGVRACIGESFAWMEGILLIATISRQWKMHLIPGHRVELDPGITLRTKYGMKMKLERNESQVSYAAPLSPNFV